MPPTALLHDCSTLVAATQEAGGKIPQRLANILDGAALLHAHSGVLDPARTIVNSAADGTLTAEGLAELTAEAAQQQMVNTYRAELAGRAERLLVAEFHRALRDGACDELLDSLRPVWDEHAQAIAEARALLGSPESSTEHMLASAGPGAIEAWQQLPEHVAVIERIGAIASRFGPRLGDFPLITEAAHAENHLLEDRAIMATCGGLVADSAAFRRPGTHRQSPWLRVSLRLNTLTEARERYRELACAQWEQQHGGPRGGWIDEDGKMHEHPPLPNPYVEATQ